MGRLTKVAFGFVLVAAPLAVACQPQTRSQRPATATVGSVEAGRRVIEDKGCGSCHRIPGVRGASGLVGPPLDQMGSRTFIAGELANTQENMIRWVMDPQAVEPGTAMPKLDVSRAEAEDISAYLASLT